MISGLRLNSDNKIDIPSTIKKIKLDVGLSWCAPNSALWLSSESDLFVIGIEPNKDAIKSIRDKGCVWNKKQEVVMTNNNYMLLECAINDVEEPTTNKFYTMEGDPGTSSLLEPKDKLTNKQKVKNTDEVLTVPLKYILDLLPWNRFDYIDLIKTDCQGIDMNVVNSIGDYLDKVVYLNCELSAYGHYHNEIPQQKFLIFLQQKGFKKIGHETFINTKLETIAKENNVKGNCLNL